jgi:hypothetical protein
VIRRLNPRLNPQVTHEFTPRVIRLLSLRFIPQFGPRFSY